MKIRHRLTIGNLVTLILFMSLVPVTMFLVHRMQSDIRHLAEVEEPLEQAILEMEINVGETARWVLHYVQDPDAHNLEAIIDSERDFERYAAQYERLAETEEERLLGRKVAEKYREFKSLGLEITALAQRRLHDIRQFRKYADTIDALIDDKLQAVIDRSSSEMLPKLEAALDMEININEAISAFEGYVLDPSPALIRQAADAEEDFQRFNALYRGTSLLEEESRSLDEIRSVFSRAMAAGYSIAALTDDVREKLGQLERRLDEIDLILDDEIQAYFLQETQRATEEAVLSGRFAMAVVIALGLIVILSTVAINWRASKAIVGGVSRLSDGASEFARGNLDHRIEVQAADELSELAEHFNKMAERQQIDAVSLKAGEEYLRTTLHSIGDAVITTDTARNIVLMNPMAETLTGWDLSEAKDRSLAEVVHIANDGTGELAADSIQQELDSCTAAGQTNGRLLTARNGKKHQIAVAASAIQDDAANSSGVVLVFRDVTEDHAIRRALEESEQRLRSSFDHITVGTVVIDDKGIIEAYNHAAQDIFGYTTGEAIGQNVKMLMPEPYESRHDSYIENYKKSGAPKMIGIGREVIGRRKDGTEFPMNLGVGEIAVRGRRSFIGSVTDLTELKTLEQKLLQSQRMEAVGQLTGGIAHDFNNILAVMMGNSELLEIRVGDDKRAKRQLNAIVRAADRAASLTDRLLAFSRQKTLSPVATNIDELVAGLTDMLRRTLGETIKLDIEVEPNLWLATVDPHQFENALVNLAINARDAMPAGGKLTIKTSNVTLDAAYAGRLEDVAPGDFVMVSVADTGTGMAAEVQERAFEPFFTTKDVGDGSGLGLSMVYGFVKQSAGHIAIDSQLDRGTTVTLHMPRSQEAGVEGDTKEHTRTVVPGFERILVVEDDPNVREVSVSILGDQGYEVVEAGNGADAIDLLKDGESFDLLFTDVVLPDGMNGFEIADWARRLDPNIKVIFTTGYAETTVVHEGVLESGAPLVNKPYRRAALLQQVRDTLDGAEA